MSHLPVHLLLSGPGSPVLRSLENRENRNIFYRLFPLFSVEDFAREVENGMQVMICEDRLPFIKWEDCAARVKARNPGGIFILLSETEQDSPLFRNGRTLVQHPSDIAGLLSLLESINGRHQATTHPENAEEQRLNQMLHELQGKNRELEKINYELDRFVYSASHDLRSPLTSVLGLLYLLRGELTDKSALNYVQLMEDSILKLDNTIRDIVAYSRNNRTEIVYEPVQLGGLVKDIIANLRYLETGELNLQEVIRVESPGVLHTDRNRLQTVLNNLLANSIRYRHPARPPVITVSAKEEGSNILLKVEDNGIGINDHHIERIFDMFYRTNESSTGSGLGLYIARETVRKMGGSILVHSNVNEGTVFDITLPCPTPHPNAHGSERR